MAVDSAEAPPSAALWSRASWLLERFPALPYTLRAASKTGVSSVGNFIAGVALCSLVLSLASFTRGWWRRNGLQSPAVAGAKMMGHKGGARRRAQNVDRREVPDTTAVSTADSTRTAESEPSSQVGAKVDVAGDSNVEASDLESWEVPLSPRGDKASPSETEKALLRVVKKLREVKAISARIQAGESVDPNQHAKAARREELLAEWAGLRADVDWERGHGGCSSGFVTVRPRVSSSRLHAEAAELVGTGSAILLTKTVHRAGQSHEACAAVPSAMLAEMAWGGQAKPPTMSSRRRRGKQGDSDRKDDGGDWTVVVNAKAKKQQATEAEREARLEAHTARQAMRVVSIESEAYRLTSESLKNIPLFLPADCTRIEELIEKVTVDAQRGLFKEHSVDLTPFRNKYFFGFAYTYGAQRDYPGARGVEAVWPPEDTSEIPAWIHELIIEKLEAKRVVPKGWINSATINDYAPGGFIVSHIDPPHLFDRPIISISFFEDCNLVFGARFGHPDEGPGQATVPALVHRCMRGNATVMKGYSADKITHGIRSCDLPGRRASIILRRVLPSAPVLVDGRVVPLQEHLKMRR